jgi:putative transposase
MSPGKEIFNNKHLLNYILEFDDTYKQNFKNNLVFNKTIDEFYTSKTCSLCGSYNPKLGSDKIYNCINCKKSIDRDINGCRNIYMKQYI